MHQLQDLYQIAAELHPGQSYPLILAPTLTYSQELWKVTTNTSGWTHAPQDGSLSLPLSMTGEKLIRNSESTCCSPPRWEELPDLHAFLGKFYRNKQHHGKIQEALRGSDGGLCWGGGLRDDCSASVSSLGVVGGIAQWIDGRENKLIVIWQHNMFSFTHFFTGAALNGHQRAFISPNSKMSVHVLLLQSETANTEHSRGCRELNVKQQQSF